MDEARASGRDMRINHVAFRTKKLARLVRFYRDVVGLRVVRKNARSVWLAIGDALLMLERAAPSEPDIPRGTFEIVVFDVPKRDLAKHKKRLSRRIEGETDFTIYFRDPDGRRVGLSCYEWVP